MTPAPPRLPKWLREYCMTIPEREAWSIAWAALDQVEKDYACDYSEGVRKAMSKIRRLGK